MKISCGTDIIEIGRIKKSIEDNKEKFLNRIYTKGEIEYCESKKMQKYQHYAARFSAKEAIFKAISSHLDSTYDWKDFEIINTENGKPEIKINYKIDQIENIDVSISHCREYAVATVVVLYKE